MSEAGSPTSTAERFLITGCQRSGTTVLGMALEAHPEIRFIEEDDRRFHRAGARTLELDLEAMERWAAPNCMACGFKAPRDSHRWREATDVVPGLRMLWVERSRKQVVSSMVGLRTQRGSWALEFAPKETSKYLSLVADQRARDLVARATELPNTSDRAVAFATICWLVKREQRRAAVRSLGSDRVYVVCYDDLVARSASLLGDVLRFLELPWNTSVLRHAELICGSTRPGGADPSRPIDTLSQTKWKARLSRRDVEIIEETSRAYLAG